jgi:integrase
VRAQAASRRAVRWAKADYLFVSRLGGPLDRHRVSGRFRAKVKLLSLPYRVRFHDLRHAAAPWKLKAGMPKERVSRMLGHANDFVVGRHEEGRHPRKRDRG